MIIGMMWGMGKQSKEEIKSITSQKDYLEKAIEKAYQYHFDRYTLHPDTCHINPKQIDGKLPIIKINGGEITLVKDMSILLNTIWIGIGDKETYTLEEKSNEKE